MSELTATAAVGQRGPADHTIRDQIVDAANAHFSHYGYGKTTVADLAKEIGFSKAYIYKFFDSKQAIGEAICARCLGTVISEVDESLAQGKTATDKLRRFFSAIASLSAAMFFNDRKIYEIAACSSAERWASSQAYLDRLETTLSEIIREGRESGEFERKTPLDEAARAILLAFQPFSNPVMLQHNLDAVPDGANEVVSLILRSLAP